MNHASFSNLNYWLNGCSHIKRDKTCNVCEFKHIQIRLKDHCDIHVNWSQHTKQIKLFTNLIKEIDITKISRQSKQQIIQKFVIDLMRSQIIVYQNKYNYIENYIIKAKQETSLIKKQYNKFKSHWIRSENFCKQRLNNVQTSNTTSKTK